MYLKISAGFIFALEMLMDKYKLKMHTIFCSSSTMAYFFFFFKEVSWHTKFAMMCYSLLSWKMIPLDPPTKPMSTRTVTKRHLDEGRTFYFMQLYLFYHFSFLAFCLLSSMASHFARVIIEISSLQRLEGLHFYALLYLPLERLTLGGNPSIISAPYCTMSHRDCGFRCFLYSRRPNC